MAKASPGITNFTSGELSPKLEGRTDLDKYFSGCKELDNFLVHPHGGATRRPGTKFITEVLNSSQASRLIPFEFNVEQTYALEFGNQEARIIVNDGVLQEQTELRYDVSDNPNLAPTYGMNSTLEKNEPAFSDDGMKFFNIQFQEENLSQSKRIKINIDQFDLTSPYAIHTAGAPSASLHLRLGHKGALNLAEGQLLQHCGAFFGKDVASDPNGKVLYIWDGLPGVSLDTASNNLAGSFSLYQFNLDDAFDLSAVDNVAYQDVGAAADATYAAGGSGTGARYPVPITGLAILPAFDSLIKDSNGNQTDLSFSTKIFGDSNGYPNKYNDGFLMVTTVSHLVNSNAFYNDTQGTQIHANTILVSYIGGHTGVPADTHTGHHFGNDGFTKWPIVSTSSGGDYRPVIDGGSSANIARGAKNEEFRFILQNSSINGIQIRSMRDYWVTDSNNNLWHQQNPTGLPTGNHNTLEDALGPGELPTIQAVAGNNYVLYISVLQKNLSLTNQANLILYAIPFLFSDGNTIADVLKHDVNQVIGVPITGALKLSSKAFDLTPSGATPASGLTANAPSGVFVSHDGARIFYNDGLITAGANTNVAVRKNFKYPYLIMNLETGLNNNVNSNQTRFHMDHMFATSGTTTVNIAQSDALAPVQDLKIPTPYTSAQLDKLRFAQSADVLYLVHPDVSPRRFVRFGAYKWAIEEVIFTRGPMQDIPLDGTSVTAGARTGNSVLVTSSGGIFQSTDVGRLIKLHDGYGQIVSFVSATQVRIKVLENEDGRTELMPNYVATTIAAFEGDPSNTGLSHNDRITDTAGQFIEQGFKPGMRISISGFADSGANEASALVVSVTEDTMLLAPSSDLDAEPAGASVTVSGLLEADENYQLGAFSATTGHPSIVTFYEQRLVFANTLQQPQTLFFSKGGSFQEFTPGVGSNDAMIYTIGSDKVNVIEYLSGTRFLVVGTSGGEFVVSSGGITEPLSPTNTQIRKQANYGSASVQPVSVANVVLFVQRAGRKVRELTYNYDTDSYFAPDMTILAEHVTQGRIKRVAFQQEPDNILWCILQDGKFVGMTYRREENVVAWHNHTIGGTGVSVEDIIALPSGTSEDDVYVIVKRTINSQTKRYIEKMMPIDFGTDLTDAWFVDSGLQYNGSLTSSISGLTHLEGQTVRVLADGSAQTDKTVSSGAISLDTAASKVTVGLGFDSLLQTMRIEAGGIEGTSQAKTKRIREVVLRLNNTVGAKCGPSTTNLDTIPFRDSSVPLGDPTPLFSGDKDITFPSGYEQDGFVVVKQDQALPMTILAIYPRLQTFDR